MGCIMQGCEQGLKPFTLIDLNAVMKHLNCGRASGEDGMAREMIQHFGENAKKWLLALFNNCATSFQIPKIWRKVRVVALLKPGRDPSSPKSYRPIFLVCILYKLYERIILARIERTVEEHLSADQAGFRLGRLCCSQVLNLTQYTEDGLQEKKIAGAAFVDLQLPTTH